MQWNWGLDGYNAPAWHPQRTSSAAQQITRNVLAAMLAVTAHPSGNRDWIGNVLIMTALVIAALAVLRCMDQTMLQRFETWWRFSIGRDGDPTQRTQGNTAS